MATATTIGPGQDFGGTGTIIPLLEVSGNLQVGFSRNRKAYALNRWVQQKGVSSPVGTFMQFDAADHIRKLGTSKWPIGTPSPVQESNGIGWTSTAFECERYRRSARIDADTLKMASFDYEKKISNKLAVQLMQERQQAAIALATTSSTYAASHYAATGTLASGTSAFNGPGGGSLYDGTTANPVLKRALDNMALQIRQDTGGLVTPDMLSVTCNVATATRLARTRELREFLSNSQFAQNLITGGRGGALKGEADKSDLPPMLYDYKWCIEDAFVNRGERGNANATAGTGDINEYMFPTNALVMSVAEGDLRPEDGDTGYSTFTFFLWEDMTAIKQVDDYQRAVNLAVTEWWTVKATAPVTGAYVADISL